jgi:hypothetical protein
LVRGMCSPYTPKYLQMLLDQLGSYNVDVTCPQEIRWLGKGTVGKDGHIVFYSCDDNEHALGVGFVVRKRVKHLVLDCEVYAYNPRICRLRIKRNFCNYSIINIHAPTEESSEGDKAIFYTQLKKFMRAALSKMLRLSWGVHMHR